MSIRTRIAMKTWIEVGGAGGVRREVHLTVPIPVEKTRGGEPD